MKKTGMEDSLPNMKERDIVKAFNNLPLHLVDGCCMPCHLEMELCCSPILFDKIEFTVILGVEIA